MAQEKEMDNLARDMIQCKKDGYGCHYGHWKAAQPAVQIPRKEDPTEIKISVCAYCGCEFHPYDNRKRIYCGDRCRKLSNVKNAAARYTTKEE